MWKSLVVGSFLLTATTLANAQDAEICGKILSDGLRDYSISSNSSEFLNTTYSQNCGSSGEIKSGSFNLGLEAVVKAIPIKFSLGASNSKEAMSNFCKTYASEASGDTSSFSYKQTIVERAYQSFDNCVSLLQTGILVSHQLLNVQKVQVFLRAGIDKPIRVRGLDATSNVQCTGAVNDDLVVYKGNTHAESNNSLVINCTRTPRTLAGTEVYDEGTVSIDVAGGKYAFFWPRDERLPEDLASRLTTTIATLQSQVQSTAAEQVNISAKVGTLGFDCQEVVTNGNTAVCPAGLTALSCSAGYNKGSHNISADTCTTHEGVDWTSAHCCRIQPK